MCKLKKKYGIVWFMSDLWKYHSKAVAFMYFLVREVKGWSCIQGDRDNAWTLGMPMAWYWTKSIWWVVIEK